MKWLNGQELAGFVKQRQAHQVRGLRQAHDIAPKLVIVVTTDDPAISTYVRLKREYGADILVDVEVRQIEITEVKSLLNMLSNDDAVDGVILQLPLSDPARTDELVKLIPADKDVDGLGPEPAFEPATPLAVMWLLAGYNIDLTDKKVLLIGHGRLVGAPLERLLKASGVQPAVATRETADLKTLTLEADVIITATGVPGLIKPDMLKPATVVVDAGTADADGRTVGDVAPEVYDLPELTITPPKGGVGPLTVCALFDNVIRATQRRVKP